MILPRPNRCRPARGGLTLVEVTLSMVIASMVMVAIGSAILLAGKAIPNGRSTAERVCQASRLAGQIGGELRTAVHVTERSARAVTFTLADRDGDGLPEVIRYTWSGVAGEPLTRRLNGAAPVAVLEDVHDFALTYERKAVTETYPGPLVESAEVLLFSHVSVTDLDDAHVHGGGPYYGQYFKPTLPAETVSWAVTRALFYAREDGAASTLNVAMRLPAADNRPSGTILDSVAVDTATYLTSIYRWLSVPFANATGLSPSQGLCLTFTAPASDHVAQLRRQKNNVVLPNAGLTEGTPDWQALDTSKALLFYVYGTYSVPGPEQTATREYVTAVGIGLQVGSDPASRIETAVHTPNAPEVLSAVWEADFNADPTRLDLSADDVPDWRVGDGSAFDTGKLSGGVFQADRTLETNPGYSFAELTTVDVRLRDTLADGNSGGIRLRVDLTGDTYAYIKADVDKRADGTQTLSIWTYDPGLVFKAVYTETGLPAGFVDVRLLIAPGQKTVNVRVDGQDRGTYRYGRITTVVPHVCWLYEMADSSGVEFDQVTIRAGGTGS